jgi:nitroreductase
MSSVLDLIRARYSCRRYLDRPVEEEKLAQLFEALRWAPSACNRQSWRAFFVTDREKVVALARAVPLPPESANAWVLGAPLIVALVARPELLWHKLTNPRIIDKDYHRIDAAIALDHLSLAATELGLGTCWIGWFSRRKAAKILGIGRGEEVVLMMAVGHPAGEAPRERKRKTVEELVVRRQERADRHEDKRG